MKAERRHDLKTNALASAILDFPTFVREYGSRLLLGLVIVALAILLIIQYTSGRATQDQQARESLTTAQDLIGRANSDLTQMAQQLANVRQLEMMPGMGPRIASFREGMVGQIRNVIGESQKAINEATKSNDPAVKADAEVLRGDSNMLLAAIPALPGADTRPSLGGDKSHEDLLRTAEDSYNQVQRAPLNSNAQALRNARFSLAAIAEDRQKWDEARGFYKQIIDDSNTPAIFHDYARDRQDKLKELSKPMIAANRNTEPRTLGPDLMSFLATQPASRQAIPLTLPAATGPVAASQPTTIP